MTYTVLLFLMKSYKLLRCGDIPNYMHVNKTFSRIYKSMLAYGSSVLSCEPSSKDFKSLCTLLYWIESMHALSKWMTANLAWQTWRHNGVRLFLFAGSAGASDVQVPLSASNACTLISRVLNFPPFFIHFGHLIGDKWFDVMIYWSCMVSTTARDDRS